MRVTVLDSATNKPVQDAEVILDGPDYVTRTTDSAGVATLPVDKPGSYKVRISQDNYRSKDSQVRVGKDPKLTVPDPFHLEAKRTRDEAQDTIAITVLARESMDAGGTPKPLDRASVSDGRFSVGTDENGHVTLHGVYKLTQQVTVTFKGYRTQTKNVPINSSFFDKGTGSATFILEPELSDSSPIRLVVEVRDAAEPHKLLNDAYAYLWLNNEKIATEEARAGEATFVVGDSGGMPLAKLRNGLKLVAKAPKYKLHDSEITADLLKPSLETKRATIYLERDWDGLRREIGALEEKVNAWKSGNAGNPAEMQRFIDKANSERQDAKKLANEIDAAAQTFPETISFGSESICTRAANLQLDIRSCETHVNEKERELETTLKDASDRAARCASPAEAEFLRASNKKAIQLVAEIGALRNKAVKDHDDLGMVAAKSGAGPRLLAQMKSKADQLMILADRAGDNEFKAAAYYRRIADANRTVVSTQLTLKKELDALSVKVESEFGVPPDLMKRIFVMEQLLAGTSNGTKPEQTLPASVSSARADITQLQNKAAATISKLEGSVCSNIATLDEVVERIDTTNFTISTFGIRQITDLTKLADACAARAARGAKTSTGTGTETTENKTDEKITIPSGPTKETKPLAVEEAPEIKIDKPSTPNTQDTSSGGFWEAAKAGKKKVENAINNKPANPTNPSTTGDTSENKSGTNTTTNKTGNKTNNPPPVDQETPEDTSSTKTAANTPARRRINPTTTDQETPEDTTSTKTGANIPGRPRINPATTDQETPEDNSSTKTAANTPARRRINPATTDQETPEDSSTTKTAANTPGRRRINPATTDQETPDDSGSTKIGESTPPTRPTRNSSSRRQSPATQPSERTQPPTRSSNNQPPSRRSSAALDLAGTWTVTTQSTGDDDMQQNWTRTNVWQISNLGEGRLRVRQVINDQTYDENYSTVDEGGGRFRLIGSNPDGSSHQMSGTYSQSQFWVSTGGGQNRITISGTRQ